MVGFPAVGERIGAYEVTAELGRGGMGIVYQATQLTLNRPVALKILDPRLAADPAFVARFSREAAILASLDSPHIIQIFDHGEVDGYLVLAMQYVSGGDLGQLVGRSGPVPPEEALQIFSQVLEALGDAHDRGIVHRDVKPSNVLLRGGGGIPFAYLCDFGIARTDAGGLTETGLVAGSWGFMGPERHSGRPATPRSDLYSAACVLWNLLTGHAVYSGTDVQVAMSHQSAPVAQLRGSDPLVIELNRLFLACLAKDPADRPATAADVLDMVRRAEPHAIGVAPLSVTSPDSGIFRPALPRHSPAGTASPSRPDRAEDAPTGTKRRPVAPLLVTGVILALALIATMAILNWNRLIGQASPQPGPLTGPAVPATPTASPVPAFLCWDGAPSADLAGCTNPSGRVGLRYLYPSLEQSWDSCEYMAYRTTTDVYDCDYGARGVIRYRYWQDVEEATQHYRKKYADAAETDLVLDGQVVGTLYRAIRSVDGVYTMSAHWLDGHLSFSVESPTKAQREELFRLVQIRAYDELRGHARDAAPRVGRIG